MDITKQTYKNFIERDDAKGCWNWVGAKTQEGYGVKKQGGTTTSAHRVFYEVFNGALAKGDVVGQRCQNTSCVNPEHLFLYPKISLGNLEDYYEVNEHGCWLWKFAKTSKGYGLKRYNGKFTPAHRIDSRLCRPRRSREVVT
jgi:hypothetical protein